MASLFETYERQYGNLTSEITLNLSRIPRLHDDERRRVVGETSLLFDETKDLIEQMMLEVQELPQETREKYSTRLQFFQKELSRLSEEFKKPKYSARSSGVQNDAYEFDEEGLREEVLFDSDMRARLLENTERLAKTGDRLQSGLKVALQTEEVGGNILNDLSEQREKLQRSRSRLRQADGDLEKSSRVISEMTRKILQNRVLLAGIGFFIIIVFIVALYLVSQRQYNSGATNRPAVNVPASSHGEVQSVLSPSAQLDRAALQPENSRTKRSLLLAAYGLF
ncbi:Vesicle transport through interaction with [Fasciola gigantica]|uniref:Vesicle transport through interaction with t-SNAREs homolog 1A n=1 Tax=Fasciola gigantica TaxID=46835 RepID=A0A504YB56_FASGI|nr:Vesicle transport through interaction with [Fasciola gigantica]